MSGRRAVALAISCALLPAAITASASAAPYAERLTLRLADVGPGYVWADDFRCGTALAGEGLPWAVTRIYLEHRHVGCTAELTELWAPADAPARPSAVTSAAFQFRDTAGPAAEIQHARDVIAYVTGVTRESLSPLPPPTLGDEAVAFRTDEASVLGRAPRPDAVVLWRSGRVLALVLAADLRADVAAEATRFAGIQQQRIEHPTPLRPSDTYDAEVPLDDPGLALDVHWLGHDLHPRGLPRLVLRKSSTEGDNGAVATLRYGSRPYDADVQLDLWPRPAWRRHARTRFGGLIWRERCVRSARIRVRGGRAVIYAGHARRPVRCDERWDRFLAHVVYDDVVVSVNAVGCWRCRESGGPYDSMPGMLAVVRALRLRTPASFG